MSIFVHSKISFFLLLFVFICIISPHSAYANMTEYRSAGWVSQSASTPYTSLGKCQFTDEQFCSHPSSQWFGTLQFGSFGNLQEFGIPSDAQINKLYVQVKGKSNTSQYLRVSNKI